MLAGGAGTLERPDSKSGSSGAGGLNDFGHHLAPEQLTLAETLTWGGVAPPWILARRSGELISSVAQRHRPQLPHGSTPQDTTLSKAASTVRNHALVLVTLFDQPHAFLTSSAAVTALPACGVLSQSSPTPAEPQRCGVTLMRLRRMVIHRYPVSVSCTCTIAAPLALAMSLSSFELSAHAGEGVDESRVRPTRRSSPPRRTRRGTPQPGAG
jgi:hypothetical protein